jgi:hypothetical protein
VSSRECEVRGGRKLMGGELTRKEG